MKKSLLALAALAALSLVFVSCGGGDDPAGSPNVDPVEPVTFDVSASWEFEITAANATTDAADGFKIQFYENSKKLAFDLKINTISLIYDGNPVELASPFVENGVISIAATDDGSAVQLIAPLTANGFAVEVGKTAKLELTGTVTTTADISGIDSIQATLVDNSQAAGWWKTLTAGVKGALTISKK